MSAQLIWEATKRANLRGRTLTGRSLETAGDPAGDPRLRGFGVSLPLEVGQPGTWPPNWKPLPGTLDAQPLGVKPLPPGALIPLPAPMPPPKFGGPGSPVPPDAPQPQPLPPPIQAYVEQAKLYGRTALATGLGFLLGWGVSGWVR